MKYLEIVTLKLKLANAVGMLNEAYDKMKSNIPDYDPGYDDVLNRIETFLTEHEKSEENK